MWKDVLRLGLLAIFVCLSWIDGSRAQAVGIHALYYPQSVTPTAITNFVQPDAGCAWSGLGGQVFDWLGQPVLGMRVAVKGTLNGIPIQRSTVSGLSTQLGEGGYLIYLSSAPADTYSLTVQLYDANGAPQSQAVTFPTYRACNANLSIVNFREFRLENPIFLPIVRR